MEELTDLEKRAVDERILSVLKDHGPMSTRDVMKRVVPDGYDTVSRRHVERRLMNLINLGKIRLGTFFKLEAA